MPDLADDPATHSKTMTIPEPPFPPDLSSGNGEEPGYLAPPPPPPVLATPALLVEDL